MIWIRSEMDELCLQKFWGWYLQNWCHRSSKCHEKWQKNPQEVALIYRSWGRVKARVGVELEMFERPYIVCLPTWFYFFSFASRPYPQCGSALASRAAQSGRAVITHVIRWISLLLFGAKKKHFLSFHDPGKQFIRSNIIEIIPILGLITLWTPSRVIFPGLPGKEVFLPGTRANDWWLVT